MKKLILFLNSLLICTVLFAQTTILPGDKSINTNLIKLGKSTMGYYVVKDGVATEICIYQTEITVDNENLNFSSILNFLKSDMQWKEEISMVKKTLKSVSRKSERDTRIFNLQFSNTIKREYTNTKTGKKNAINSTAKEPYFDIATYPLIICALPLATGYKATIPVIDYDAPNRDKIYEVNIIEVKSYVYTSDLTGEHQAWRVGVTEESTGNIYLYEIDKETRKIYKVSISSNGNTLVLINKETDVDLFKTAFDKEAIRKMMNDGSSIISGEAFARDDRSGKDDKKIRIDVLNMNKKQFAPKGTKVLLLPNTAFYKEWFELNKKQAKIKGAKPIPLPKEAASQVKITEVFNDKGNFEFVNLMAGEFLLFISFNYEDYFSKNEVVGKSNVYVNGSYQGTEVYTDMFGYTQQGNANFSKSVTIKTDGEKVYLKLKR